MIENKAEDEHDEKDETKRDEPVACLVKFPYCMMCTHMNKSSLDVLPNEGFASVLALVFGVLRTEKMWPQLERSCLY